MTYDPKETDGTPDINFAAALFLLGSLIFVATVGSLASVFRAWRYEEDEYGLPIRRQNRYTGRVQVRTREGWVGLARYAEVPEEPRDRAERLHAEALDE